jgi:hypothetical protein
VLASIAVGFDPKFTMVAGKAMHFAVIFNAAFSQGLPGPVHHKIEMIAPAGPSTAGGKQALQHIRLVPADGGPAIVIGSANGMERAVELRTFDHIAELHTRRFKGAPLPIDPEQYKQLLKRLQSFFGTQGLMVTMTALSQSRPPPPADGNMASSNTPLILVGVLFVMLAILVVIVLALRARHVL